MVLKRGFCFFLRQIRDTTYGNVVHQLAPPSWNMVPPQTIFNYNNAIWLLLSVIKLQHSLARQMVKKSNMPCPFVNVYEFVGHGTNPVLWYFNF